MAPPLVVVFDVNETLLSLDPITDRLVPLFDADPPTGEWFARLLHGSLLANAMDEYRPFASIAVEALTAVAARRGLQISIEEARNALAPMTELPPHPDVLPGLTRLASAGIRMAALTNGSAEVAESQVSNAGLDVHLETVISVEEVGRFKPDPTVYLHAADVLGVPPQRMLLVASHDWDCAGAMAVGAEAAFISRPGVVWSLPSPPPTIVVDDVIGLADALGV